MTQREKMVKALKKIVISNLTDKGFQGKFPHYKKLYPDRIELLVFMTNKWGNSFAVEISTIFPGEQDPVMMNYYVDWKSINEADVYGTLRRFRLKGMFDGWFYYSDVYYSRIRSSLFRKMDFYNAVGEKKSTVYTPEEGEVLVQKACDELYSTIADEVNHQMESAYAWWEQYNTPKKMKCSI